MFKHFVIVAASILAGIAAFAQHTRKEMPFEKYNFVRTRYNEKDFPYQMGNAEMGGLTEKRGLGFEKIWFTDVWGDKQRRKPLSGPLLNNPDYESRDFASSTFHHELNIKYGITTTDVQFPDSRGYQTTIFFSKENKHLLAIGLKNTSKKGTDTWRLSVPASEFEVRRKSANQIDATKLADTSYTRIAWAIKASKKIDFNGNEVVFSLKPNESITILYSVATHWDGDDYPVQVQNALAVTPNIKKLEVEQQAAWDRQWTSIASVILPDGEYAKWFYRCIAALYATSGAEKFTAGEEMFSIPDPDWHMHAFTYGHGGGWSVWAFALLGDVHKALNIAQWLYKPNALRENVRIIFPQTGPVKMRYRGKDLGTFTYLDRNNPDAIAFPHEMDTEGFNIPYTTDRHWDMQRHIDGYAGAFYHLLNRYYPDEKFEETITYPVLRGVAEFYSELVKWDSARHFYYLPPLLSVAENIMEKSVLDATLSVRWALNMAANYANRRSVDSELSNKWRRIASNLNIPQNDSTYLEYLDDPMTRKGGGYFGIRAFNYLGYPFAEQITDIDLQKARRSIDRAWKANNYGQGMISFIAGWYALTEAYLGYGQNAYDKSKVILNNIDPSGACLCEVISTDEDGTEHCVNKYFLTGYDAFILAPLSMVMQSYSNQIKLFPAMPKELDNVEFYDLPAEAGVKVSSAFRNGEPQWVNFRKGGKTKTITSNIKKDYQIDKIFD